MIFAGSFGDLSGIVLISFVIILLSFGIFPGSVCNILCYLSYLLLHFSDISYIVCDILFWNISGIKLRLFDMFGIFWYISFGCLGYCCDVLGYFGIICILWELVVHWRCSA